MIYKLARSFLFRLDAEHAHEVTLNMLRRGEKLGLLSLLQGTPPQTAPVECMGLSFPNPVGLAAGLDKEGSCIDALGSLGFGSIEIGTITPKPQEGNPQPRLFRIVDEQAIINRMGFNNPGIEQGVKNVQTSKKFKGVIGFNIGKNKVTPNENAIDDYLTAFRQAYPVADYITVNISSPNTPGLRDLQTTESTTKLIDTLKSEQTKLEAEYGKKVPIALKVAPDLEDSDIVDLSQVFKNTGLDGLICNNTTISREAIKEYALAEQAGGLSGAPLTERSLEVLKAFKSELGDSLDIISVGGIMTPEDAITRLDAGAKLVQLYSGFVYHGPPLVHDILKAVNEKSR